MSKKATIYSIGIIGLILATIPLLGADNVPFLKWWMMALILGLGYYPLGAALFSSLKDRGYIFSKVLGIGLAGFLTWVLVVCGVTKFTSTAAILVTVVSMAVCWILYLKKAEKKTPDLDLILGEELIFLAFFLLWTYFAGFRPEAKGTEKFMDYGFMAAMMRSDTLPAQDLWYSAGNMNYYYGGQYYAVFLTKLSFTRIQETYNLMRTMVASFAFVLPFSMVFHMIKEIPRKLKPVPGWIAALGGLLGGAAVSLAGNMHYVLYGLFGKVFKLSGYEDYWFPASTRYIGHNPLTDDQCIHEFPSYSFVLGDLHAHVVNVMFVLLVTGILYAWMKRIREREQEEQAFRLKKVLLEPPVIAAGILTGIFHWTNYWDFVIYTMVIFICIFFTSMYRYRGRARAVAAATALQTAEVFLLGTLAALPFTSSFETMVSGVALSKYHTVFYQLLILWGLPFALVLILLLAVLIKYLRSFKGPGRFREFFRRVSLSDTFALILGICGIGLVLIPELFYVRDIYENGYARSNTMFKLTYQAFIMFGIAMAYAIIRLLLWKGRKLARTLGAVGLALVLLTCGYFGYAVECWFGNVRDVSGYRCLDATAYLENVYPEDAAAIRWLDENVEGSPVVLEANGDSYSDYCRVSAMTGLPTVLGWYVHEWLWRGDTEDLNEKAGEIQTIYTSDDQEAVEELLEKYDVEYIFVGSCEREKYGDSLNEELLAELGEIVFQANAEETGGSYGAYVIKVSS